MYTLGIQKTLGKLYYGAMTKTTKKNNFSLKTHMFVHREVQKII
jgi:hypothetical protein